MPSAPLLVETHGHVRVLTLNRPEARNALNRELIDLLADALEAAEADERVRALVLSASGGRAFCAGADLRERAGGHPVEYRNFGPYQRFKREGFSKPAVAAVGGPAVAAGFELVLACDMVVCSATATFALPEVQRGLFAAGGGMLIGRRLPPAVALELGLTGEAIDAVRAHTLGLVNRVVADDMVPQEALRLATAIAGNGPLGVAATRRILRAAPYVGADELWALNDSEAHAVFSSDDAREGARAFIERRAPVWTGH